MGALEKMNAETRLRHDGSGGSSITPRDSRQAGTEQHHGRRLGNHRFLVRFVAVLGKDYFAGRANPGWNGHTDRHVREEESSGELGGHWCAGGQVGRASTGRMGKDGAPSTPATGWSVTSSAGSSSETSGLAVSE